MVSLRISFETLKELPLKSFATLARTSLLPIKSNVLNKACCSLGIKACPKVANKGLGLFLGFSCHV